METRTKTQNADYLAPRVKVINVIAESIICASNVEMGFRSYGEEDDWDE